MFQRTGAAAYRKDLHNIIQLCEILGNPHQKLKCIHVAGTNGKGSVTHLVASVLQEQKYSVGIFISPHYKDYRERIKVNGKCISKTFVTKFVEKNIEKFKTVDTSFFEITTAMAFEYFKQKKVDFAVIETGMGGRLDSTNIINPVLSVITNISYDHQQFLGNTLEKIAGEKAGIIKPNVTVVIGETQKGTKSVFVRKAKETTSEIFFADKNAGIQKWESGLKGNFQKKNIATALMAVEVLQKNGVNISETAVKRGLKNVVKNTSFIGRWMIIQKNPLIILDSAHNEAGIKEVIAEVESMNYEKLHFVFGTVNDKEVSPVLHLLPKNANYYFCKADIPRGMNADDLKLKAEHFGLTGKSFPSVKLAFKTAKENAGKRDLVLVAGSVFVVAEIL